MSIVKDSSALRDALEKRLIELYPNNGNGFKQNLVIKDAEERGFKIAAAPLSKYFKGIDKGSLSELQIVFLALRYGIGLHLKIDVKPFNEAEALTKLEEIFKKKSLNNE